MHKIIAVDDIEAFNDPDTDVRATHEGVLVGFQGIWVKLDLSDANYEPIAGQLGHLLKIGQPVKAAAPAGRGKTPTGQKSRAHGRRTADYYEGLVAWADKHQITKRDGSGRIAYASLKEGRHDYPDWLIRDYDQYLETGELPGYVRAA